MPTALTASLCSTMITLLLPTSFMHTLEAKPSSSGVGGSSLRRLVAPTARQRRRSSNLEVSLITMIFSRSRKCIAISPTEEPLTTTLQPVAAIALMRFSSAASSDLE